jgi:TDG/mug DNA glycosylase family protein
VLIPDVVAPGLRVVFCGTALGAASHRARAYYAGPGNRFWPTLREVGLTPRVFEPREYPKLLELDIGLTDVCKLRAGSDAEIGGDAFDAPRLIRLLEELQPGWVAFNGKRAAMEALGVRQVEYGPRSEPLGGVPVIVLPSTSGAASGHWDIGRWRELAVWV